MWYDEPCESLTWLVSNLVSMKKSAYPNLAYLQRLTLTSAYGMISDPKDIDPKDKESAGRLVMAPSEAWRPSAGRGCLSRMPMRWSS